jgi:hypothetical protein
VNFLSVESTPSRPKKELRKTMIVSAKAAALTSGPTVEAFAHDGGRVHAWSTLQMVARKLGAATSQAAAPVLWSAIRVALAVRALFRGDMTEQACKPMATLGVVVSSLGKLEAVLSMASTLAKRHVDYGVKAADYAPVGVRCCGRWSRV